MNAAHPDRSERLQRVLALLKDGQPRSTLEIVTGAQVCAVNSVIAELRTHGYQIECSREGGVWFYQMEQERRAA